MIVGLDPSLVFTDRVKGFRDGNQSPTANLESEPALLVGKVSTTCTCTRWLAIHGPRAVCS